MPTAMLQPPLDSAHWYVTEQAGLVKRFDNKPDAAAPITVLDIHQYVDSPATGFDELGLLGIAFHPNFATNHYVYLLYSVAGTSPRINRISRFTANASGTSLDQESVIMNISKPSDFHNGGTMHFGPDGYLYIGLGDGGKANDPGDNAQNPNTVLGKMLRIDVDHGSPYAIPADNPNAANPACGIAPKTGRGTAACPEIFASGFRNPWKWSFDFRATDPKRRLWVADVGQDHYEEVDLVESGKNYGWSCREGLHPVAINANRCANVDPNIYTNPINEYGHDVGQSVTGGYFYRGAALPDIVGHYVFGDFQNGYIWYLNEDSTGFHRAAQKVETNLLISSFAQGNDNELYFLSYPATATQKGHVYALRRDTSAGGPGAAPTLSQTGCVIPNDAKTPAPGLIPYAPVAPFWSDGAVKQRWIALPDGDTITISDKGDFDFPPKTVLVKNFWLGSQLVETRLFMRHPDGIWAGYSYEWNAQQTDATLVDPNGKQKVIGTQTWTYPSQADCLRCHTGAAGFSLGPEAQQLNNSYGYPNGKTANQMDTFLHIGLFRDTPPAVASLPDPFGNAPLDDRARAYLQTNCSGCHRPNGPTQSNMDLQFATAMQDRNICNMDPHAGDAGVTNGKLIVPGDVSHSILYARMHSRGEYQMPPLATSVIDDKGSELIAAWITSLTSCE